jgi:SAM-dependent methyltransferase
MNQTASPRNPAEIYEEMFVPALFGQWGPVIAELAAIRPGDKVLDVACGTGVLACAAADRAGPAGQVTGLDANPGMLAVARRKSGMIDWKDGRAEALPFADASFDAVVSQFGFMFFDDQPAALREMMRVLRPGGRLAVAVWDDLDHAPGYAILARLLEDLFGRRIADAFRAPFVLGDETKLRGICNAAGLVNADILSRSGTLRFASLEDMFSTERACIWTLGGLLDDASFDRLLQKARPLFHPLTGPDGAIAFAMPALIMTAAT